MRRDRPAARIKPKVKGGVKGGVTERNYLSLLCRSYMEKTRETIFLHITSD